MITEFTRKEVDDLSKEIQTVLAALAKRFGVSIKFQPMNFTDKNIACRVDIAVISQNGQVETREAQVFRDHASQFGLSVDWLGKSFSLHGQLFRITGMRTRSVKAPVLAQRQDGVMYALPADTVRSLCSPVPSTTVFPDLDRIVVRQVGAAPDTEHGE